jgi:hypothetical protein
MDMLMTDVSLIRQFVFAGRAVFTLRGQQSRYTYQVNAAEDAPGLFFVRVLTGPDIWTYAGVIRNGIFNTTAKSGLSLDAPSIRALRWFLNRLPMGTFPGMEFWHEGKCCRCARPLTDPESIAKGIGPVCEAA